MLHCCYNARFECSVIHVGYLDFLVATLQQIVALLLQRILRGSIWYAIWKVLRYFYFEYCVAGLQLYKRLFVMLQRCNRLLFQETFWHSISDDVSRLVSNSLNCILRCNKLLCKVATNCYWEECVITTTQSLGFHIYTMSN